MDDLGIAEPSRGRIIRLTYALLGLFSFFTAGEDECRAWTLRRGATAVDAAGAIHSDLARGFIRAEVISYDDLIAAGIDGRGAQARHAAPGGQGLPGAPMAT